jgi:molybdate transport system substrate-binding protein
MRVTAALLAGALVMGACGGGAGHDELLVSAAASLTDAFGDLESAFEAEHPGVDVVLNLAGSSTLRDQILDGAPADVFAPADLATMQQVEAAGAVAGGPGVFARNRLEIAVPAGNPAGITGLDDLENEALFIGLCAEGVPCGDLARRALNAAGVSAAIDTNEASVRALLSKIEAGELDAGITYVTDVIAGDGAVEGVAIPPSINPVTDYPIAVLAGAAHPETARAFVAFVRSDEGRAILARRGFETP